MYTTSIRFLAAFLALGLCISFVSRPTAGGWVSIFDGKTLNGWKVTDESPETFSVQDGAIVVAGPRAHLFYEGPVNNHNFKNFEWKAQVKTMPGSNSGMFIHTAYQPSGWPSKGYEIQVNQTHTDWRKTGSVYGLQDVKEVFVKDGEWYTEHIIVQGKKVVIKVNDKIINDYTEADSVSNANSGKKLSSGTIALQGHDPKSKVFYKDIQIKVLPD
ncbi:3-keto-disaccharide hydrolase [Spirosoma lituiforme]